LSQRGENWLRFHTRQQKSATGEMFIVVASDVAGAGSVKRLHSRLVVSKPRPLPGGDWYLGLGAVFANARYNFWSI
jgi:hypothetical protein